MYHTELAPSNTCAGAILVGRWRGLDAKLCKLACHRANKPPRYGLWCVTLSVLTDYSLEHCDLPNGDLEVVKLIVEAGADNDAAMTDGKTSLLARAWRC